MKPLNRPMFKYGGPTKEGIMNGMKEPVRRQAALVGDPVFPKAADGRAKHFLQIPMIVGAGLNALRAIPAGMRAARFFGATPGKLGFFGRTKDLLTPRKGIGLEMGKPGESVGFRIGSLIKQNPITALSTPSLATSAVTGGGPIAIDAAKGIANFLVPGTRFDPFGPKKENDIKTTDDTGGIKRLPKDKVVTAPETGGTGGAGDDSKKEINEARIEENRQKYYKLMGIDKMKKGAVYDSLIDASNIIQKEGGDLKGAIKSGSLQNQIINAISKNLDKSVDLKKSIDAAILKGEIQKDINQTKPSAFAEQVQYIRNNPNDPLAKKLSGMRSVADDLAALADKPITSDIVSRLVQSKGTDVAGIIKDDKYQKWEKNNEGDEIDYLQDVYKGKKLEEGIYIINKKAISIDKDGFASPLDLDSIIG